MMIVVVRHSVQSARKKSVYFSDESIGMMSCPVRTY
jgi:hypothetical protein